MPAYLKRLRYSLCRRSHPENAELNTASTEDHKGKQRADAYDLDEVVSKNRRSTSPPPLPEITDAGPPAPGRYANEDIFWNSIMTEADVDPVRSSGRTRRNATYQNSLKPVAAEPWIGARGPGRGLEAIREEVHSHTPEVKGARKQQRKQTDNKHSMRVAAGGRNRADNDLTVMFAYPPRYPPEPSKSPSPPREPIKSETEEWDDFMGFPSENSMHIYRDNDGNRHVVLPVHAITRTEPTTAKLLVTPRNQELAFSPAPEPPTIGTSSHSQNDEVLTWNLALNRILESGHVDPVIRQAVRERVQNSSTINGSGYGDEFPVSALEAGLVPNFSYPIPGSAFYERLTAQHALRETYSNQVLVEDEKGERKKMEKEEILTNGVTPGSSDSGLLNESNRNELNRAPTFLHERSDRPDSEYSSESDNDDLYRAPIPLDEPTDRVHLLLCSMLTPSELSLHYHILNPSSLSSSRSPLFPASTPASNAESSTPRPARLIVKLTTIILGLQDRLNGLEDNLVPQLSTWLEQKSVMVDNLSITVLNQKAEITKLKHAIDFGNRVLSGCWDRECEVWRTLMDIQMKRQKKNSGLLRKLMERGRHRRLQDVDHRNEDISSGQQHSSNAPVSSTTGSNATLSKRELDPLLAMTAQNVRILKEDVEDMVTLVKDCKRIPTGIQEIARAKEGSWRDV